ncbi:GNAT family N-acetyltransferase [Kiloniella sp. EL199]|uniref:GNAT family N-acetyltransferase n=1 Tax=Kiloniella sp. EL199 TaxID=2107581 RepID=UPI000EA0C02D|nr:GNAT family N-acetyltransferase [Kiloniella sp. EL199]
MEIREAVFDDWEKLLEWVNSPESLSNKKLTVQTILESDHKRWLESVLGTDNIHLFMILDQDQPVGQMRFQEQGQQSASFVIDIYIEQVFRGRDLAFKALTAGMQRLRKLHAPSALIFVAVVKTTNTASLSLFRKLDFILDKEDADFSTLKTYG